MRQLWSHFGTATLHAARPLRLSHSHLRTSNGKRHDESQTQGRQQQSQKQEKQQHRQLKIL